MRRSAVLLYVGLGVGGLIIGVILGQVLLAGRGGLYVGPLMAIIGLILAWMLRATQRPPDTDLPPPMPTPSPQPRMAQPINVASKPKISVRSSASRGRRVGQEEKGQGR